MWLRLGGSAVCRDSGALERSIPAFVPVKKPKTIIDRLSAEVRKAMASPDLVKRFVDLGAEPMASSPEEFGAFVKAEYQHWGKLIKDAGIRIE